MKYLTLLILLISQTALAQTVCFPTCSSIDGKFMAVAGSHLSTLDEGAEFKIRTPSSETNLILSFFDGDTESSAQGGTWDYAWQSGTNIPLDFTLYADPLGDGSGATIVWTATGLDMVDDNWKAFVIPNVASALSGGEYIYRLIVELPDTTKQTWSVFKVAVNQPADIVLPAFKPFSFAATMFSFAEIAKIYPAWPSLIPTSYNGIWEFEFDVPAGEDTLTIEDGDLDRGKGDDTDLDTDDPDSSGVPVWAGAMVRPEGVASVQPGDGCTTESSLTSCPADDRTFAPFARSPSIEYNLIAPDNTVYLNDNPSGNLEVEEFTLSSLPDCNTVPGLGGGVNADYCVSSIQEGTWRLRAEGVDLANLNVFVFPYETRGITSCP